MQQLRDDIEVRPAGWLLVGGPCLGRQALPDMIWGLHQCRRAAQNVLLCLSLAPVQAFSVQLSPECLADIEQVYRKFRDPAFN